MKNIYFLKNKLSMGLFLILFISIIASTIAYSSISTLLTINSGTIYFKPEADLRIVDIKLIGTENGGIEEYNPEYSVKNIKTGIMLPSLESTVTYEITLINFSNIKMKLLKINHINFNNSDIKYVLEDMDIDSIVPGVSEMKFKITFEYEDIQFLPENISIGANIEFIFVPYDNVPPIITVLNKEKEFFITQTSNIILSSYVTALDNVDGDLTDKIVISSSPELSMTPGTYEITYKVSDNSKNEASEKINIIIWNFIKISTGMDHSLALGSNGSVWTFGANNVGQRGLGNTTSSSSYRAPTRVPQSYFGGLPVIDIVATGWESSSYAVNSAGQAYGWGEAGSHQLGNGSTTDRTIPVAMTMPSGITFSQISAFYRTGAALGDDGNIYTWGSDNYGSCGRGGTCTNTPTAITSSGNFTFLSQGTYGGAAITSNGDLYIWGTNVEGEMGQGSTGGYNKLPTLLPNFGNFKEVNYGARHLLAITNDGKLYAWGDGGNGRLCRGSTTDSAIPILISGYPSVDQVIAAYDYSLFKAGNEVYGCGNGNYGTLFGGNTTSRNTPYISNLVNITNNVKYIGAGDNMSSILSLDGGIVYSVGSSGSYDFGNISINSNSTSPVPWSFTP